MSPDFCFEQQTIAVPFCEIKLEEELRAEHGFFGVVMGSVLDMLSTGILDDIPIASVMWAVVSITLELEKWVLV